MATYTYDAAGSDPIAQWLANGAGTEKLRITSAGKLGLGVTSPSELIDAQTNNGTANMLLKSTDTGGGGHSFLKIDSGSASGTQAGIKLLYGGTQKWEFRNTSDDSNKLLFFDASSNYVLSLLQGGDIGMGTPSPVTKLHIQAANPDVTLRSTLAYNSSPASTIYMGGKYDSGGTIADMGYLRIAKENASSGDNAGYLALATRINGGSMTERMRIISTGKVGIGLSDTTTINAGGMLTIEDSAPDIYLRSVAAYSANPGSVMYFLAKYNNGGSVRDMSYIRGGKENGTDGNDAGCLTMGTRKHSDQMQERFRLTSEGRLGLGTSFSGSNPPASFLHIEAFSGDFITLRSTYNYSEPPVTKIYFGGSIGASQTDWATLLGAKENGTYGNDAGYIALSTRPNGGSITERLRVTSDGNVGMNTTDFGGGVKVIGIADAGTNPSSNPSGGVVLYSKAGKLWYRGANGDKEIATV